MIRAVNTALPPPPPQPGGVPSSTSSGGTPSRSGRKPLSTAGLKGVDPKLAQLILDEIIDAGPVVTLDDIAGNAVSRLGAREDLNVSFLVKL